MTNQLMGLFIKYDIYTNFTFCYNMNCRKPGSLPAGPYSPPRKKTHSMSAKYIQIANTLRNMIEENPYGSFKLPTEAALCRKYHVSRTTARKALSVLEKEHLIQIRQGSGSYATGLSIRPEQNTVAILITSDSEYIYPALLTDIRRILQNSGFSVQVYVTDNLISRERELLKNLLENPVRGILTEGCKTCFPTINKDLYEKLQNNGVSILFFHGSYSNLQNFPYVKDDNYGGGYYLGKYLVSLGHRKIAGIFNIDDIQGEERCYGFLSALRDEGVSFSDDMVCWFDTAQLSLLRKKQNAQFLTDFADKIINTCTAVICHNDEIAYWLMKELQAADNATVNAHSTDFAHGTGSGIKIPEDMSIICFDNSYLSELSSIRITSLSHKNHEMGEIIAENIIKLMRTSQAPSLQIPWHLAIRQSTGAPPV